MKWWCCIFPPSWCSIPFFEQFRGDTFWHHSPPKYLILRRHHLETSWFSSATQTLDLGKIFQIHILTFFRRYLKEWLHNFWIGKPRKLRRAYLLSWTENEPQMSDTTSDTVLMIMYLSTFHKMKYQISHQKIAINSREFEIDKHESLLKSRILNRIFFLSSIIEQ